MTNKYDYDYQTRHKYVADYKVGAPLWWWNRPWWNAYNTNALQGQENYVSAYKEKRAAAHRAELSSQAAEVVKKFREFDIDEIDCLEFWNRYQVTSLSIKRLIKGMLYDEGYTRKRYHPEDGGAYYFTRIGD